jgi:antitoxin YefM
MMAVTATEARRNLFSLIEKVNQDREEIQVLSRRGKAYLVSAEEYESLMETAHLLRSPQNAEILFRAHENITAGRFTERELIEADE